MAYNKSDLNSTKRFLPYHLIRIILIAMFSILLHNQFIFVSCARPYRGKKHSTNSPIYFISAPFSPHQSLSQMPPSFPTDRIPYVNIDTYKQSARKQLIDSVFLSTTPVPIDLLAKQKPGIEAAILSFLQKTQNRPNFGLQPSTNNQSLKVKVRRRRPNKNSSKRPINLTPVRTINVNFSLADLKQTFNQAKQVVHLNDQIQSSESKTQSSLISKPDSINHLLSSNASINLLGEILLKSVSSKYHNLPLQFLSNAQPNLVMANHVGSKRKRPVKKIRMKKNQNSKIINLKLRYLSNAQPVRALINPFSKHLLNKSFKKQIKLIQK